MPGPFENVILRALAKDPSQRFQTAAEFAVALEQASRALPADSWVPLASSASGSLRPLSYLPTSGPTALSPGAFPSSTPATPSGITGASATAPPDARSRAWLWGLLAGAAALALLVVGVGMALVGGSIWLFARDTDEASQTDTSAARPPPANSAPRC